MSSYFAAVASMLIFDLVKMTSFFNSWLRKVLTFFAVGTTAANFAVIPRVRCEYPLNPSSNFVEWYCVLVITTTPRGQNLWQHHILFAMFYDPNSMSISYGVLELNKFCVQEICLGVWQSTKLTVWFQLISGDWF